METQELADLCILEHHHIRIESALFDTESCLLVEESYPPHQWHSTGSGRRYISCFLEISISEVIVCVLSEIWPNPIQWYPTIYIYSEYITIAQKISVGWPWNFPKVPMSFWRHLPARTGWVGWLSCLQHFGPLRGWCPGRLNGGRWRSSAEAETVLLVGSRRRKTERGAEKTKPPKEKGDSYFWDAMFLCIYIYYIHILNIIYNIPSIHFSTPFFCFKNIYKKDTHHFHKTGIRAGCLDLFVMAGGTIWVTYRWSDYSTPSSSEPAW